MNNYFWDFYVKMQFGVEGLFVNNLLAVLIPCLVEDLHFRSWKGFGIFLLKVLASILAMNLLCALSYLLFGHFGMSQFCGGTLAILYLLLFSKSSPVTKIVYGISFIAAVEIVFCACFAVYDIMIDLGRRDISFFGDLLLIVLMMGCVFFFKTFSLDKLKEVFLFSVGVLGIVCAACTVFWIITNVVHINAIVRFTVGLMILVLLLAVYYSGYAISRSVERTNSQRMKKLLRETDENMLETIERNMEGLRRARHEIGNQYMYMKELLQAPS